MFSPQDALDLESSNATPEEAAMLMQRAINSGLGWHLQGVYGRSMMAAIEAGECMLGEVDCRDAAGNPVPSRDQVQAGTKGSREYVVDRKSEAWAAMLDSADAPAPAPAALSLRP